MSAKLSSLLVKVGFAQQTAAGILSALAARKTLTIDLGTVESRAIAALAETLAEAEAELLGKVETIATSDARAARVALLERHMDEAIDQWPAAFQGAPIDGGEAVEWLVPWLCEAEKILKEKSP